MPPKSRNKGKSNSRKMAPPLPQKEVLTDLTKKQWIIGASIGKGGFGEIYLSTPKGTGKTASGKTASVEKAEYVIKIEPHENGPLFSELSYYRRTAKKDLIDSWISKMELTYLGIPPFIASGCHDFKGQKYRFMVMQRFGDDLQKHFVMADRKFCPDTICYLALRLLEALQFLHESEYVHADIKGSNLLTGYGRGQVHRVYLVDYGLAFRFNPEGIHKEYKEDRKRSHDGTVEFTSIDAHNGVSPSRRGDLEILGYCLLQWACGKLPWESNLEDKDMVAQQKIQFKSNVEKSMVSCFRPDAPPGFLRPYITAVYKLEYEEVPDYSKLKKYFSDYLGSRDAIKSLEWISKGKPAHKGSPSSLPAKQSRKPKIVTPEMSDASESSLDAKKELPDSPKARRAPRKRGIKNIEPTTQSPERGEKKVKFDGVEDESDLPEVAELGYRNGEEVLHPRKRGLRRRDNPVKYSWSESESNGDDNEEEEEEADYDNDDQDGDSSWDERSPVRSTRKKLQRGKGAARYVESQSESEDDTYRPTRKTNPKIKRKRRK